jgi:hypothetical protein
VLTARTRCGETNSAQIYRKTGNLPVQLLLGHTKLESTVRYLGVEVDDALTIEPCPYRCRKERSNVASSGPTKYSRAVRSWVGIKTVADMPG